MRYIDTKAPVRVNQRFNAFGHSVESHRQAMGWITCIGRHSNFKPARPKMADGRFETPHSECDVGRNPTAENRQKCEKLNRSRPAKLALQV